MRTRRLPKHGNFTALFVTTLAAFCGDAQAVPVSDVSAGELAGFTQIYQLNIGSNPNFSAGVPYGVNNSGQVFPYGIARIAYYMELQSGATREWVWVSVNAFTQDLTKIGVPGQSAGIFWQQVLSNMNIESNDLSIVTGTGIATGNIEFWSLNYGTGGALGLGGNNGLYDFDDTSSGGNHGSMQIHNFGQQQTLFALNRFNRGEVGELGVGPNQTGTGNPDWTFNQNTNTYTLRNFEVWVQAITVPEPATATLGLLGFAGLMMRRRRAA